MASRVWMLSLLCMQISSSESKFTFEQVPAFEDNFNTFNIFKWQHVVTGYRGKGDSQFQYYTKRPENSYVRNGVLYLKPTLTADRFSNEFLYNGQLNLRNEGCNLNYNGGCYIEANDTTDIINPIQSARIRTIRSFSFRYGKVQVRAKMPRGDWLFSAIWLVSKDNKYGSNPRSGEIDLLEIFGNENYRCKDKLAGTYRMTTTLHWGVDSRSDMFRTTIDPEYTSSTEKRTCWKWDSASSLASDFHVYAMEWTPEEFHFSIDGNETGWMRPPNGGFAQIAGLDPKDNVWNDKADNVRMAPFDKPFYVMFSVVAGGNSYSENCKNKPYDKPWSSSDPMKRRKFWEAKDQWYPTWDNGTSENNAMQIDWIRVYKLA